MTKHEEMVGAIGDVLELFGTAEYLAQSFCEMDSDDQVALLSLIASTADRWEASPLGQWHAIGREARKLASKPEVRAGIEMLREIVAAYDELEEP